MRETLPQNPGETIPQPPTMAEQAYEATPAVVVAEAAGDTSLSTETTDPDNEASGELNLTPMEVTQMPEVLTQEELKEAVRRFVAGETDSIFIPAKAEIGERSKDDPAQVDVGSRAGIVQEMLQDELGHDLEIAYDNGLGGLRGDGTGDAGWHTDSEPDTTREPAYHVHTTTDGSGRVRIANVGPELADRYERNASSIPGLKEALAEGQTDVSLMDPAIQEHSIEPGDTIIFRTRGANPVWHEFVTAPEGRDGYLYALQPAPEPVASQRPDLTDGLF